MPYIEKSKREQLEIGIQAEPFGVGELNFVLTKQVQKWLGKTPNYASYNSAVGVLECMKLELYRRMVAPYENEKIKVNGDVY